MIGHTRCDQLVVNGRTSFPDSKASLDLSLQKMCMILDFCGQLPVNVELYYIFEL